MKTKTMLECGNEESCLSLEDLSANESLDISNVEDEGDLDIQMVSFLL